MISYAVQRGPMVYVYNEKGQQVLALSAQKDALRGYTSSTVTVARGAGITVYDERGQVVTSMSA